ncbi:hypothetical protein [Actinomadura atramentaria]|uniref:hypothetical protein n=1 Tax=Actinomadura atramentaria TaxID=1990 RepID=UPI0012FC64F4|nr:hypothetical protein [Actinomadura atramentaria]
MATLIASTYYRKLIDFGYSEVRAALIVVLAEERTEPEVEGLEACPADAAMHLAQEVADEAFADAMRVHGLLPEITRHIEQKVRAELHKAVAEQINVRAGQAPSSVNRTRVGTRPEHS